MDLFIREKDRQIQEPTAAISWTLSNSDIEECAHERQIPFVLVAVVDATAVSKYGSWSNGLEDWKIVRADDQFAYLSFKSAGPKLILGAVLREKHNRLDCVKHELNRYSNFIVSGYKELENVPTTKRLESWLEKVFLDHYSFKNEFEIVDRTALVGLEVAPDLFAAEPLDFKVINWFFAKKPKDQCNFGARRIAFYSLLPIFLLFGLGKLILKAVKTVFLDNDDDLRLIWKVVIVMAVLVFLITLAGVVSSPATSSWLGRLGRGSTIIFSAALFWYLAVMVIGKWEKGRGDRLEEDLKELSKLSQKTLPEEVDITTLFRRGKIYLGYSAIKAKVCRPFAR